jgi:hypothetical protein
MAETDGASPSADTDQLLAQEPSEEVVDESPTSVLPPVAPPPQTKAELLKRLGLAGAAVPAGADDSPTTRIPRVRGPQRAPISLPSVSMPSGDRVRSAATVLAIVLVGLLALFGIAALASSGGSGGSSQQDRISVKDSSSGVSGSSSSSSSDQPSSDQPAQNESASGGSKPSAGSGSGSGSGPGSGSSQSGSSPGSAPPADLGGGVNP